MTETPAPLDPRDDSRLLLLQSLTKIALLVRDVQTYAALCLPSVSQLPDEDLTYASRLAHCAYDSLTNVARAIVCKGEIDHGPGNFFLGNLCIGVGLADVENEPTTRLYQPAPAQPATAPPSASP